MTDTFIRLGAKISPLDHYRSNVYSQNGEDGIINEVLCRIGKFDVSGLSVVEFGAWDGRHLSNTFSLVERGASALFIEGDATKFIDLLETQSKFPNITPVQAFVAIDGRSDNSLATILTRAQVPPNFDILSIDIDSYDLDVWDNLEGFRPGIVIIEITSEIKLGEKMIYSDGSMRNSFSSAVSVAAAKGYVLVAHVGNLIFVRDDLAFAVLADENLINNPDVLYNDFWSAMPLRVRIVDYGLAVFEKIRRLVTGLMRG